MKLFQPWRQDPKGCKSAFVLRRNIEQALTNARFRWASCQLQALARLKLESAIRNALIQQPRTLDETYERILVGIREEYRLHVWRALAILCSDVLDSDLDASTLASAISQEENSDQIAGEELSIDALQEIASGLIKVNTEAFQSSLCKSPWNDQTVATKHYRSHIPVALAHYSVKEYLFSERIGSGPAKFFKLSPAEATMYFVRLVLKTVLQSPSGRHSAATVFPRYCLDKWLKIVRKCGALVASSSELSSLVFSVLDPRSQVVSWAELSRRDGTSWMIRRFIDTADPKSVPHKADILCKLVFLRIYATTTAFLVQHPADEVAEMCASVTPLSISPIQPDRSLSLLACVASHQLYDYLVLLLEQGAVDSQSFALSCALENFTLAETTIAVVVTLLEPTVKALIEAHANVDGSGVRVTPLQIALRRRKFAVIKLLLAAGADANAIGDQEGWEPPGFNAWDGGESPLSIARRIKKSVLHPTYFWWTMEEMNALAEVEEILVRAGAREFTHWSKEQTLLELSPGSASLSDGSLGQASHTYSRSRARAPPG
jgi:hypothetical protein